MGLLVASCEEGLRGLLGLSAFAAVYEMSVNLVRRPNGLRFCSVFGHLRQWILCDGKAGPADGFQSATKHHNEKTRLRAGFMGVPEMLVAFAGT